VLIIITNNIETKSLMDQHTYDNWVKIKETFEKSGNMNNMFYKRACEIVKTKIDPLAKFLGDDNKPKNE
jgi:hypothetical protein